MRIISINFLYLTNIGQVNNWFNMAEKKFPQIAQNFDFYNRLLSERKSIFTEVIEINKRANNHSFVESIDKVEHPEVNDDSMVLCVEVKINNHNYFQFKLRYEEFTPAPFFRFDSDGTAHQNKVDGIPLNEQLITTPHFHKFNEKGIEIAYKTDKLLDPRESKVLEDIEFCIAHFFFEANLRFKDDDIPEVRISSNELALKMTKEDPNHNITFL